MLRLNTEQEIVDIIRRADNIADAETIAIEYLTCDNAFPMPYLHEVAGLIEKAGWNMDDYCSYLFPQLASEKHFS